MSNLLQFPRRKAMNLAAADAAPTIEGHVALYNTLSEPIYGYYKWELAPGCFDKAYTARGDQKMLWDHESRLVLGSRDANTCKFSITDEGLFGSALPPDSTWALDLIKSMKRGDIHSASFGFYIVTSHWRVVDGWDVEVLDEVDWVEGSVVTFPRFPGTANRMRVLVPSGVAKQDVASVSRAMNRIVHDLEMDDTDRSLLVVHRSLFDDHLPIEIKEKLSKRVISAAPIISTASKADGDKILWDSQISANETDLTKFDLAG
jgi:HK97 family phage prohead protease